MTNIASETLEKIARLPVPTNWKYRGSMNLTVGGKSQKTSAESGVAVVGSEGRGTLSFPYILRFECGATEGEVSFFADGTETTIDAFIVPTGESSSRDGTQTTTFRVIANTIQTVRNTNRDGALHRITVLGMRFHQHENRTWSVRMETTIFDRPTLITGYVTGAHDDDVDAAQVIYEGKRFDDVERDALLDVLRFLTATRGGAFFLEDFDTDLARLGFRFEGHGGCLKDGRTPVGFGRHPAFSEADVVARDLPTMVAEMRRLRERSPAGVAATIHHYNDGSVQTYPTSKVRDMSVALEALGFVLLGRPAERTPIIPDYNTRAVNLRTAFDAAFADLANNPEWEERYAWLRRKFDSLNVAGPREEIFDVLDSLGIALSKTERIWISKMRNGILHNGHHGNESVIEDLQINAQAADLFANVYVRSMLRLLKYSGPYRDFVSNERFALNAAPRYPLLKV